MQPIPFKMKGTDYAITIKVATYPEGNLAIKLYQENFGQLMIVVRSIIPRCSKIYRKQ